MAEKRFLIAVKRRWMLFILPILALAYFAGVVVLAALDYQIQGVTMEMLALVGVGLFALVLIIELPYLFKRKVKAPKAEPIEEEPIMGDDSDAFAPVSAPARVAVNDEYFLTNENAQGLRVLEYSSPAKSQHKGAVYAKSFVPVTKENVLRIETLAAEGAEL